MSRVVVTLLGGESIATAMLPIEDGNSHFGSQRFQLASPTLTLGLDCFVGSESRQDFRLLEDLPKLLTSFATPKSKLDRAYSCPHFRANIPEVYLCGKMLEESGLLALPGRKSFSLLRVESL